MKKRSCSGLTLIEVAIAVVMSSIALTATASAVTQGAILARSAAETRAAVRSMQTMIERVRATPFAEITATFNGQSTAMSQLGTSDSSGACTIAVAPVATGSGRWTVLAVTTTATWRGVSGVSSRKMTTYVCDRTNGAVR